MEEEIKDLVIIGSGPAGLSAAVYGQRALFDQVVIEKEIYSGGQIVATEQVDNYLGMNGTNGYELAARFREHADELGVVFKEGQVCRVSDNGAYKEVFLADGSSIKSHAVLVASGASHRKLGVKGEKEFARAGVSYCATCDGAFFRGQTVAVAGGGFVALEDALYLSNLCEKVYLIHRREQLRGSRKLQEEIRKRDNIEFLPYCEILEICGEEHVESISIVQNQTGEKRQIALSAVFIAIGMMPQNDFIKDLVATDESGYICAGEDCRTSVFGIYAAGDIRTKPLRQIITAASDGAVAAVSVEQDQRGI